MPVHTRQVKPPKTPARPTNLPKYGTPEWATYRAEQLAKQPVWEDVVYHGQCGHEYGIRVSTALTMNYRERIRPESLMITPQQVIDVLVNAGVKKWVLMGLHGYVGYLSEARATQDVDILIGIKERGRAIKAVSATWPTLLVEERHEVIRFRDPGDKNHQGEPKVVIDLMLPRDEIYKHVLESCVVIDSKTHYHIPTLEAALAGKYAAMLSLFRDYEKRLQDSIDFRLIVRASPESINRVRLKELAEHVFVGASDDIDKFIDLAINGKPFPL